MVLYLKFLYQGLNSVVQEMGALIAHQNYWKSNLLMMFSKRNCAAIAASQFLTALASAHLVRYSVLVMIYLAPICFPGGLIGPTKSIAHMSNVRSMTCGRSGISSRREGFPTLWQISQHLQKSLVSLCNVGHHNPAPRIFCAVGFAAK